jgi:hypothetical protein
MRCTTTLPNWTLGLMHWRLRTMFFREAESIETAPRDGTSVRVLHGPFQLVAMAYWHRTLRGWVRVGDELLRALRGVTSWCPR